MTLPAEPISPSRSDARLRLVCAALNGFTANRLYSGDAKEYAESAVDCADACLALLYPEPEEKG